MTVDAEAGYGMAPAELIAALQSAGAAGCNLEDTDHSDESLRDPDRHAEWSIALWEADALRRFTSEVRGPANIVRLPQAPSLAELAALGVARVSWGHLLYRDAMARFEDQLASLQE